MENALGNMKFSEGQIVWIRHIYPPQSLWDESIKNYREYRPDEERILIYEAFVAKVGKKNVHIRCKTGGHMNQGCTYGKFDIKTLEEDSGKFLPSYTLHLTKEHAEATVKWWAAKP
jgi:hypothetical protein